ncbi:MAG: holo-ACP synthase [Oscillospiraceae bacterium]|jgi:holo-[acyl-carrier protein] synthase|nr:holo-ACP synthase [Oscillospiraceae bacterium]
MIGIDLVEINRIKKSLENRHFLEKIYTEKEQEIIKSKNKPFECAAGRWCAKEAFSKALGTGFRNFEFRDIEVLNDELGCPYMLFYGEAKELLGNRKANISISHTEHYATAVVILM